MRGQGKGSASPSHRADLSALASHGNHMGLVLERLLFCEDRRQELKREGLRGERLNKRLEEDMRREVSA